MKGLNDLQTKYPDLAKEWDRIRNGNSPTMVRATSDRNSFWVDKYGHKWVARVSERVQGRGGCPKCREKSKRIEILDYVAEKAEILGLEVKKNAEYFPGIPFEAFIPKIKTAIVVTKDCEGVELKNQDTLNYYCMSSGIAMFRVLFPEAPVFSNCKVYRLLSTEDEGYKPIIDNLLEVEGLNIVKKLNNAIASTYGDSNPQDDVETLDSLAHVRARKNNRARTGDREFDNDGLNDTLDSKARHGALGALEEKNGALEFKARNGVWENNSSSLEITHKIAIGATSDALLANNLIRIIREWPEISQDDLAQQLGVTRRVIQRVTNNLKKKGIIDRTGGKRFGRWEVYGEVDDVVISNANSIPKENKPTTKAKKSQKKKVPLSPKKKKYSRYSLEYHILAAIKENPYITQIELSESLDSAICTIKRTTTRMIDDGTIIRTGGKRFGKWEIVDPDNN